MLFFLTLNESLNPAYLFLKVVPFDIARHFAKINLMKRHAALLAISVLVLSFPSFSFAASQTDIVTNTLDQAELVSSTKGSGSSHFYTQTVSADELRSQEHLPEKPPASAPKHLSGMSEKKRKAVAHALKIAAGYNYNHIHYSEWRDRNKLNEDFGYQDGLYAELEYKSGRYWELIKSRPFINLYYRQHSDIIQYKGATIGPPSLPYNAPQRSKIEVWGAKLGGYGKLSEKSEFFGYLDFGRRTWHRGENEVIDGVLNYYERYRWAYYGPGVGFNYQLMPWLSAGLDAKWMFGIEPKMWADLFEGGTFDLQDVWGSEISIPVRFELYKKLNLDVTPYYTFWNIHESNPVTISGTAYVEPDSQTHEIGVLVGFSYTF